MGPIISACCFNIVIGAKSGPIAFLGFRDLSSLITPEFLTVMFSMSLNGEIPLSGILLISSVNTDSYWSANASAFAALLLPWLIIHTSGRNDFSQLVLGGTFHETGQFSVL